PPSGGGLTACAPGETAKQANANTANAGYVILIIFFMCLFPFIVFSLRFADEVWKFSELEKSWLWAGMGATRVGMRRPFCLLNLSIVREGRCPEVRGRRSEDRITNDCFAKTSPSRSHRNLPKLEKS